jgi:hypothetical protein
MSESNCCKGRRAIGKQLTCLRNPVSRRRQIKLHDDVKTTPTLAHATPELPAIVELE